MKRTLLFIMCVLASITMWAQEDSNDYIPFVELGKQWHLVINPTNPNVPCSFETFKMFNEVQLDGKTYVKLDKTGYVLDTLYQEAGLFREEDRRVYKYEGGRDIMLYDFSLKEGDTFTYEFEPGLHENCKVLKQGWLEDGPLIVPSNFVFPDSGIIEDIKYRKLRTWTIGRDNGLGEYLEAETWVEGAGRLRNMFYRPDNVGIMCCLAYIEREGRGFYENAYLPFSLYNMYGPVYGCDLPAGEKVFVEGDGHQLTYELEGDRMHIFGKVLTLCGNNYAFFYEKPTDDPLVHKIEFRIQEAEPIMDCVTLQMTDFYVSGFNPNLNYIVVDNYGEEHPVINKTPEQTNTPDTSKYFPTGMTWEEVNVNPSMEFEYENAHIYEIGTDTIIGGVTYKKVLKDNVFSGLCVRESGDKVWLLTKEYPTEILLYNFDWDSNQDVVTEYLKGHEVIGFIGQNMEAYEVRQETTPVGDSQTVVIDGKTYQYYRDSFIRSQIRGIGKVAELNRYSCLLSYREPAVILPGLNYHKVHWIKRNGKEIFRSDYAKEWTSEAPRGSEENSLYGEWWLVGWNDGGNWHEVDTNYVGHRHLSIEIPREGYVMAYSMVNQIFIGLLTLNGNEMIFGGEMKRFSTEVYCNVLENLFFENHICDIKSYQIEGKMLKLYYTDNDYFVFTSDLNNYKKTESDYRPFVEEGKVWKVGNSQTILDNSVQVVDYYYFDGDTIIDGKTCKQMMCQRFVNPDYSNEYWTPTPSLSKVGAWYEENQKVYFYDEREQSMKMKYDFSLEANDTLQFLNEDGYPPFIIGPKQMGGIKGFKGIYRDIMMGQNIRNTIWLEGVGGLDAPFRNVYDPRADLVPEFLMSCVVGDEVIYLNDVHEDGATPAGARKNRFDFTHTIKVKPKARTRNEEDLSLYGEYNERQLSIDLNPISDAYQVRITNESGKAVYEKIINAGRIVALNIDISTYPDGHYTVTVENSNESFTGEFNAQKTGIQEVRMKKEDSKSYIYNLQGQRISSLQKGLNIVNGRKVFVK